MKLLSYIACSLFVKVLCVGAERSEDDPTRRSGLRSGLFDVESQKLSPALEDIASSHMTTRGPQPSFTVTHSSMQVETTPEAKTTITTPSNSMEPDIAISENKPFYMNYPPSSSPFKKHPNISPSMITIMPPSISPSLSQKRSNHPFHSVGIFDIPSFSSMPSSVISTQISSNEPTTHPSLLPSMPPTNRPSISPSISPSIANRECYSIVSIVNRASKAAKQAKRLSNFRSMGNFISTEDEIYCSKIRSWSSGQLPKYETQPIVSVEYNTTDLLYPIAIKLEAGPLFNTRTVDTVNPEQVAVVISYSHRQGFNASGRVNIIEVESNGSFYIQKNYTATLTAAQPYTFNNWRGTGKDLSIQVRSITNTHPYATIELNFDRAIPNDSMASQILCGYQGWFAYPGDGAPINKWKHWFSSDNDPSINHLTIEMYPHMDEYDAQDLKESNILMGDGSKAKFYSGYKPNVVKKHFEWMRDYGISGVFHMRFMSSINIKNNYDWKTSVLRNVRAAAESTGRVFAVSYNIAGNDLDDNVLDDLKNDWIDLVDNENVTSSGRYIHHNGLPVLRVYGIGFKTINVSNATKMLELIQWFQVEAEPKYRVFLIGGVPSGWRELNSDSRDDPLWQTVYESLDGIHPWHVGRWSTIENFDLYYENRIVHDVERCKELGILYMPTMWPGFSWHNLKGGSIEMNSIPRLGGRFMWRQAFNYIKNQNISSIWMAQFDEVDEGTAIYKVAATQQNVPAEGTWLSLDADGIVVPNDWYLRLCGEAQKMFLGQIGLTDTIPIST